MKRLVEQFSCDICKKEAVTQAINYPVIFHTEQTEGRSTKPYVTQQQLDVCDECGKRILMLDGWGAQGINDYKFREQPAEDPYAGRGK